MPAELMHEHHKIPRSAKGPDHPSNLIKICPVCHNAIDRGAVLILKGHGGRAQAMVDQYFPRDLGARSRLVELINIQAKSWQKATARDERPVVIKLPHETYEKLKIFASLLKTPKGRKMGVSRYISSLLIKFVEDKSRQS